MDKVNLIQEANKMANPNALSIGQKLVIPVNKV
jgi:nucleoid-associated protein YgaU